MRFDFCVMTVVCVWLSSVTAFAAPPSDVWTAANATSVAFSADGTSLLARTPTGFQLRRSTNGSVEKTITLPEASRDYDAVALSPDKQLVGLTYRASSVTWIELYSTANGNLVRSIDSGAVRNARGISISNHGLVAIYERYAYGGGGTVRVFNVVDGSPVSVLGPYTRNSTTHLVFSPDGNYLAVQVLLPSDGTGIAILRTSDWSEAQRIGNNAGLFEWSHDSASIWALVNDASGALLINAVDVPSGQVAISTRLNTDVYFPYSVTPDDRFLLASSNNSDALAFLRTSNGAVAVKFNVALRGYAGSVSPNGDLFSYGVCPENAACVLHVARVPAL